MAVAGSDLKHLLNLKPHGCQRRLWYEKKGVEPDVPVVPNRHMMRGSALETIALRQFEEGEGRNVELPRRSRGQVWRLSADYDVLGVHVDAFQFKDGREDRGVVEMLCPSVFSFLKARHAPDPPAEKYLQLQWGLMCWELSWGSVVLFCADQWLYAHWDRERDDAMIANLRSLAFRFWATLTYTDNPHERLDREDKRCADCPFRGRCQGIDPALQAWRLRPWEDEISTGEVEIRDESAAELIEKYAAAQRHVKDAKAAFDEAEAELYARFAERPGRLITSAGEATLKRINRKGYTTEVKPTTYFQMRVKPTKESEHGDVEFLTD